MAGAKSILRNVNPKTATRRRNDRRSFIWVISMNARTLRTVVWTVAALLTVARTAFGIAGFSSVASEGRPVQEEQGWPAKIVDLVNDPARTVGWNFWFSECPNDVNHYAFAAKNTEDLNRLIKKLAETKAKGMTVQLALGKEFPAGGFSFLKPGNGIPAVVAFGNQVRLNQWYAQLEQIEPGVRKFGVHRYTEPPKAMAPALTIYMEHPAVDLTKLEIPSAVKVVASVSKEDREKRKSDETIKGIDRLLEMRQRAGELR